jgi:hypothetical protein
MANETSAHSHNTHREQQDHVKGSSGVNKQTQGLGLEKNYIVLHIDSQLTWPATRPCECGGRNARSQCFRNLPDQ